MHITPLTACRVFLTISAIGILYNLLVVLNVISFQYAWGGRLETQEQAVVFGLISIVTQVISSVIMLKSATTHTRTYRILSYILAGIFALNTLGNLAAVSVFEKVAMTPLTALTSSMALVVARGSDRS